MFKNIFKNLLLVLFLFAIVPSLSLAQLSGTKTIPGDYATIAAGIADLNTQGVGAGGVTFNVAAGHTETLVDSLVITATGTSANQIIFQKSGGGANPLITGQLGSLAPSTTITAFPGDFIISIDGGDYITIDGISLRDNPAATGNEKIEVGYMLRKASGSDACKNVTIKNCVITLDKTTIYSWGIYVSNFVGITGATVASTGGRSENIKIFNNNISNVYGGIQLRGFADVTGNNFDYYDHNIEIGVDGQNSITNYGGGATTAYGFYAIYQDILKIANNLINSGAGTTTTLYGMFTSTGQNSNVDIYNNTVRIEGGGDTETIYAINSSMGSTGTDNTVNIYNNIIESCSYPTATTGAMYHIYNLASALNVNIYGNIIRNNSRVGTSGIMYLLYSSSTGTNGFVNIYNNQIYGNSNTAATGDLYCLRSDEVATSTKMIYDNTIYENTGNDDVFALITLTGTLAHIYNNEIYDITSTTTGTTSPYVTAITCSTGTNIYVYNNFISDLKTPNCPAVDAIRGINVNSATVTATRGLYFNTIYLNATSTGTNFGTTGIYHINSTTATTATLDMRNNVVVNLSVPNGTGRTVAFRRSAVNAALTNYSDLSNSNDFYAGTSSASKLIFFDGTNADSTIAQFKTRVDPRESVSFSENPPFLNVSTTPYNLHLNSLTPTQIESGGQSISTPIAITNDFDGNVRNVTTPDVGADEFNGTGQDLNAPLILLTPLLNTGSLNNRTLVATITDASGVPNTAPGWPYLYWKINAGSWTGTAPSSVSGSDYTYNFGAGVAAGDTVRYYLVAQDMATIPNVGASPSAGAGGYTINPPAASTPPTSPFSYAVTSAPLSGNLTVGLSLFRNVTGKNITFDKVVNRVMKEVWFENPVNEKSETPVESTGYFQMMEVEEVSWRAMENGQSYTGDLYIKKNEYPQYNYPEGTDGIYATITAAVTDLNLRGVNAPTNFLLVDAAYPTETFPITIDINNEFYPTATNTVTFKPNSAVTSVISGSSTSSIFKLNSADYIIFDGSNSGGSTRNLTVENTSTATNTAVFWNSSLADGQGATNNTFKNMIIKAGSNSVTSTFGIYSAGTTISTTGTGGDNDNLTIQNNQVIKSYRAIYVRGTATGLTDGLNISQNEVGSSNLDDYVTFRGIDITNAATPTISSNTIFNMIIGTAVSIAAIEIGTNVTNAVVSKNYIHTMENSNTGGWSAYGVFISTGTGTSGITIVNNMIADLKTYGDGSSTTFNPFGIRVVGGTGHKIYYNSINMFGAFSEPDTNNISAAIIVTSSAATGLDIRNNILSNSMTGGANAKCYTIYGVTGVTFGTINNNDYYSSGPNGVLGFLGSAITTLTAWRTATGQDVNSIVSNPFFTSNLDLHVNAGLTPTSLESGGAVIAGYTTDFDGHTRPGPIGSVNGGATAPDIGVDEFDGVPAVPMVYVSSAVTQNNTSFLLANTSNNEMVGIQVVTAGEDNPLILQSLDFTTAGTTNLTDITNAKVWYTGTSSTFATTVQFGATLTVPTAGFTVNGTQSLSQGTNYFWLTFDVPSTVTSGNVVDAQCSSLVLSTTPYAPSNPNPAGSRTIVGALAGSYDVGVGQDFVSISDAVFALNVVGVNGPVTFNLTDSDYSTGESFPLIINAVAGASSTNTITFKPASSMNPTISGSASGSLIKLNGADYVTFDGSNSGGSSKNLTIQNNSTATSTAVIWISSLGTGAGAENNTIKNCFIKGGSGTVSSQFGIYAAGTTVSTTGTGAHNNNLTILNNSISRAYYGVYVRGVATTGILEKLIIKNNEIGSETSLEYIGFRGVQVFAANDALIEGNTVFNIINSVTNLRGIELGTGVVNSVVTRNKIYEINYTATSFSAGKGITLETGDAASNITVSNNLIYALKGHGSSTATNNSWGIMMINGGGYDIYYNTVVLSDDRTSTSSADLHGCVYVAAAVTDVNHVNNIILNVAAAGNASGKTYGLYSLAPNTAFSTIDYNYYYAAGTNRFPAFLGTDLTTLTEIQTAFGSNLNSAVADPTLNSYTNLRPQSGSPVLGDGTPIAGITVDYAGVTRNATTPSIGAYETGADAIGPVITYTPLPNTSSTSNRILSNVVITDLSGINVTGFKPRIYFKKTTDANVFGGNTSGDNGWKWTETSQVTSPFSFTVNNSIIFGGSVALNDSIEYFVVAQDLATVWNVSANPSAGFVGTSVSNITSAPTTPNIYKITGAPLAGNYTVGLALFNKVNNRNLVMETRTRKVMVEIPVEEEIIEIQNNKMTSSNNLSTSSGTDNSNSRSTEVADIRNSGITNSVVSLIPNYETDVATEESVAKTVIRYETVEIEEEYTVLTENGELFIWKPYSERQFDNFEDGVYPTIAAAAADVTERGISDAVYFILVDATYSETYPIVIGEAFGTSSTDLVTFKPQTGLAVTINAPAPTTAMFHLNGADWFVFDGLNSGGSSLTLTNASTTVPTFLLENGATNNTLKNLTFNAQYTSTTNGVINLLSTSSSTGNSNNSVMNNLFNDNAGSRAAVYINSAGNTSAPNEMNTVSGNHFKNFTTSGVRATTGSGGNWTISNNQFYNDITATTALVPISFIPGLNSGGNNTISGNFIGGSAPNAGGTPMTTSSSFAGITINADSVNASTISNNVVQNISLTGTSTFNGISSITNGVINITGNTIGHNTNPNSIVVAGTSTTHGINVTSGSLSQANLIENNLIAYMHSSGTGTGVRIRGIHYQVSIAAKPVIRNNVIHDLSTTSTAVGIGAGSQTAYGIFSWPGSSGAFAQQEITGNTVYNISADNTGAVSTIAVGIAVTNFFGEFSGNQIYDIRNLSTGTTVTAPPIAVGLYIRASTDPQGYFNNMISIGDGQSTNTQFNGIWNAFTPNSTGNIGLYFNSINISGTSSSGSLNSHGFMRGDNTGAAINLTVELRNNIFSNMRSGGTGKHYSIANQGTVPNDTGWSAAASDYNLLNSADPSTVGLWGTTDQSFSQWQTTTGGDANSYSGEPVTFVNVTTGDLHLNMGTTATVLESGGIDIPLINFDFDNDVRPGPTGSVNGGALASDIGADEFDGVPYVVPDTVYVSIMNNFFVPADFTIQVGDYVTWTLMEGMHTTSSNIIPPGAASWNYTFSGMGDTYTYHVTVAGDYNYECLFHPGMNGAFTAISSSTFALSVDVTLGWNMVSAPGLHPTNQNVETWWPHRTGTVWEFSGVQYVSRLVTTPGEGYWMKNTLTETYNYPAIQIVPHNPVFMTLGWNLMGGYETSPTITALKAANPQITGTVWGFNGVQYVAATNLVPGYGYWAKVTAAGNITIPDALAKGNGEVVELFKEDWGRITITDAAGISSTLYAVKGEVDLDQYEMPPLPPAGMFDVRYTSNRIAEDLSSIQTIDMTSVEYPITVTVENMTVRLQDETGKLINQNINSGEKITISNNQISKLRVTSDLIPTVYALEQNYPNPFNPSTTIEFSLPEDVNSVKLTIYNALGERVAELVNGSLIAGKYSYQWNAGNVATGMYIYELRTDKFVSVKKMVLLK